jgi:energy-coupling factor transporter ATP-binding protein EcfA2
VADKWNLGSRWQRWDPHMHAPGTLRNNQFGDDWDAYFRRIAEVSPAPVALGITDYFSLRCYKEFIRRRPAGALPSVALVFPNIEFRLTIETKNRQGINLHFLVSPDDPDHVGRVEEKLAGLRYKYRDDWYVCSDEGLRRLGKAHQAGLSDEAALADGANQFKVELGQLREMWDNDPWIRSNVLVAVAAGSDGLAGLTGDVSFHSQREELGRFAHIVFSGNPSDRSYWLGQHQDFAQNGQTPKPCLHGSDCHRLDTVLQPELERRCWIRAEPTFDGVRQTLAEPERRVFIGPQPPDGPSEGDVIRIVRFRSSAWLQNEEIELNPGLVTVIGSRGSGKTALADLIAFAAESDEEEPGDASFLKKAGPLLNGLEVEIEWADGLSQSTEYPRVFGTKQPRVHYLSQKFVESLCAPDGGGDALDEEIEHVVFSAIPEEDRFQCSDFAELRRLLLDDAHAQQASEREIIREKTNAVATETKLQHSIPALDAKVKEAERNRKTLDTELKKIPIKADETHAKAYDAASKKLVALKEAIAAEQRRQKTLQDLTAEVRRYAREVEAGWQRIQERYASTLEAGQVEQLRAILPPTALPMLAGLEKTSTDKLAELRRIGLPQSSGAAGEAEKPQGLAALEAECEALSKQLGLDKANVQKRADLMTKIPIAKQKEETARKDLEHAKKAQERRKEHQVARVSAFEALFAALASEEDALQRLYGPLREQLQKDARLQKLSFTVQRYVDLDAWVTRGEQLFDRRKRPFGDESLEELARRELLPPWEAGAPATVREAMANFLEKHVTQQTTSALLQGVTLLDLGEWLFATDHISVHYGIQYEGQGLNRLSPGTRGVVLLTLYLALDQWDRRPLVIDQPEENLDPRSVYDDLRPFFRDASLRRQIVMVTHNANLVVNTDSDQVIVASASRRAATELPQVTYAAGGLEDAKTRDEVCRILEGGREAFDKRRQRYESPLHDKKRAGGS